MEPGKRTPHRRECIRAAAAHSSLKWLRGAGSQSLHRDGSAEILLMWQIRWVLKPLVFLACLIPALNMSIGALNAAGVLHIDGISLGADPVKVMLHTCGRWTLNFLMITLCMTPLKDLTHSGVWLRFRRMFGLFAFCYVLLHFSVYLLLDQSGKLGALWQDIVKRPYITICMLRLLLLIPLSITSTVNAQRRLGTRWTRPHRLVYVAAILCLCYF